VGDGSCAWASFDSFTSVPQYIQFGSQWVRVLCMGLFLKIE
jgi:hypothetical protein